jgi:Holliday junction DNA helicase RuvA
MLPAVIGWLSGVVVEREPEGVILDVGGVGYEVALPAGLLGHQGQPGEELALFLHTHATSESPAPILYGFLTSEQRKIFRLLLRVKGIGPKLAHVILAQLGEQGVVEAIRLGDLARLRTVTGVGKKTAQQVILDLSEQVGSLVTAQPQIGGELASVVSALINMGFKRPQVDRALGVLRSRGVADGPFDEVLRRALGLLGEM